MKIEIKVDKEIIDFCNLNGIELPVFIYDCIDKGFTQNKWGKSPLDNIITTNNDIKEVKKKKIIRNKKTNPDSISIEQKKSDPVKQAPINDIYGED